MNRTVNLVCGIGLGAGLMYFLDPRLGRRRRAIAGDRLTRMMHRAGCALDIASRDAVNRVHGLLAEARSAASNSATPDDRVLSERVRSRLGRVVSHPRAIQVAAGNGTITLTGVVLASEVNALMDCLRRIAGVHDVENRLDVQPDNTTHPLLQGGKRRGRRRDVLNSNWPPSVRFLAGSLGVGLMVNCMAKRDTVSVLLGTLGFGLFLRATANEPVQKLIANAAHISGNGRHQPDRRQQPAAGQTHTPGATQPTVGRLMLGRR